MIKKIDKSITRCRYPEPPATAPWDRDATAIRTPPDAASRHPLPVPDPAAPHSNPHSRETGGSG